MSRRLLKELRDCLEGAVLTALTGFGLSLLLLTALFGQADMARVAAVCAIAALATCVLAVLPVRIIVPLLIAGIALSGVGGRLFHLFFSRCGCSSSIRICCPRPCRPTACS